MTKSEIMEDVIEILRDELDYHNTSIDYDFYANSLANRFTDYIYENYRELEIQEA